MATEDEVDAEGADGRTTAALIGGGLLGAGLLAFVLQNTQTTTVDWLMFDAELPVWLLLTIAVIASSALTVLFGWVRRRRR